MGHTASRVRRALTVLLGIVLAPKGLEAQPSGPYGPYGDYDVTQLVVVKPDGRGVLNVVLLDQLLGDLEHHALTYPPTFDTVFDQQRAKADVTVLAGLLERIDQQTRSPELALVVRTAVTFTIAHNFDLPDASPKAREYFERAVTLAPKDPMVRTKYGTFLFGTGQLDAAQAQLQRAVALGDGTANLLLAQLHLVRNEREKGVQAVERYVKAGGDRRQADQPAIRVALWGATRTPAMIAAPAMSVAPVMFQRRPPDSCCFYVGEGAPPREAPMPRLDMLCHVATAFDHADERVAHQGARGLRQS